jgi:hypothetical protein
MKIREHAEQEPRIARNKHCREQALQGTIVAGNKCTREQPRQGESVQFNKIHREHTWLELKTKKGKNTPGEFDARKNGSGTLCTLQVKKRVMGCPHWVLFEV